MKAAIFYSKFFDHDGLDLNVGGIETYLYNLANLCRKIEIEPIIFQFAHEDFEREFNGIRIIGISALKKKGSRKFAYHFEQARRYFDIQNDIVIFGADRHSIGYPGKRCVSIQHGISFDLPNKYENPGWAWRIGPASNLWQTGLVGSWFKMLVRQTAIRDYRRCANRVCVDYNFINWYRTFLPEGLNGNNWVIPNFAEIPDENKIKEARREAGELKILFARRFLERRGTRIMAAAAKSLLQKHPHVFFTFAGEGPDQAWLEKQFKDEDRVKITKYSQDQITEVHLQHHIAVIPSLGSEGTSLSVAEAMASGCAVVATAIGGVTNMILDGYNGKLCMPTATELEQTIDELIIDSELRELISRNGHLTAKHSFSKEKWEKSWTKVLQTISQM